MFNECTVKRETENSVLQIYICMYVCIYVYVVFGKSKSTYRENRLVVGWAGDGN